jgi:hypothetical protein
MAEEKGGALAAFATMGAAFARTPFPYLLGCALLLWASRWDGHLHEQKGCFQLQETQGKTYKVDTCSGKVEALEEPKLPEQRVAPKPNELPVPTPAPKRLPGS